MLTAQVVPITQSEEGSREREFIRGNRDGPKSTNDTYTVCRLRVGQSRLDEEMRLGVHSHFVTAADCWDCPAHAYLKAEEEAARESGAKAKALHTLPSPADLKRWLASDRDSSSMEALEIIHREPNSADDAPTYTICRVAVPRHKMVHEVEAGLHPWYHVREKSQGRFVQGNPTRPLDNVNYPESRTPGLGLEELCPYRLLRPGSQL